MNQGGFSVNTLVVQPKDDTRSHARDHATRWLGAKVEPKERLSQSVGLLLFVVGAHGGSRKAPVTYQARSS